MRRSFGGGSGYVVRTKQLKEARSIWKVRKVEIRLAFLRGIYSLIVSAFDKDFQVLTSTNDSAQTTPYRVWQVEFWIP